MSGGLVLRFARFLFLAITTLGLYPVVLALRTVGRSLTNSGRKHKRYELVLVSLNEEQSAKAKQVNGNRKQITHALLCGPHGQIFGTKKQCFKYYSAWKEVFPELFSKGVETKSYEIVDYVSTFNLVNKLIEANDSLCSEAVKPNVRVR